MSSFEKMEQRGAKAGKPGEEKQMAVFLRLVH
jgi:hypothetical protein